MVNKLNSFTELSKLYKGNEIMGYSDKELDSVAEGLHAAGNDGSKNRGISAEQATAKGGLEAEAGKNSSSSKSSEALKILGAGKPFGCTTKEHY